MFFFAAVLIATADHLRLHALPAQHAAGGRDHARDRRGLAARPADGPRLRARPVFDAGALPGVRDRRLARRAEDERHHAGRRPRHHRYVAARYTFRRLFLAGLTALLRRRGLRGAAAIEIPVIQDLAITATIGVAVLIFTNLILLPGAAVLCRRGEKAAAAASRRRHCGEAAWQQAVGHCVRFTERRWAMHRSVAPRCSGRWASRSAMRTCRSATSTRVHPNCARLALQPRRAYINAHYGACPATSSR
jgi:hypothetical protein